MSNSDEIWKQVYPHATHVPRKLIVAYIKAVADEAKALPAHEREAPEINKDGSVNRDAKGVKDVSKIVTCIASQDWIDEKSEPKLEEILSAATQLDMNNTHDKQLWQELFEKVERL